MQQQVCNGTNATVDHTGHVDISTARKFVALDSYDIYVRYSDSGHLSGFASVLFIRPVKRRSLQRGDLVKCLTVPSNVQVHLVLFKSSVSSSEMFYPFMN